MLRLDDNSPTPAVFFPPSCTSRSCSTWQGHRAEAKARGAREGRCHQVGILWARLPPPQDRELHCPGQETAHLPGSSLKGLLRRQKPLPGQDLACLLAGQACISIIEEQKLDSCPSAAQEEDLQDAAAAQGVSVFCCSWAERQLHRQVCRHALTFPECQIWQLSPVWQLPHLGWHLIVICWVFCRRKSSAAFTHTNTHAGCVNSQQLSGDIPLHQQAWAASGAFCGGDPRSGAPRPRDLSYSAHGLGK